MSRYSECPGAVNVGLPVWVTTPTCVAGYWPESVCVCGFWFAPSDWDSLLDWPPPGRPQLPATSTSLPAGAASTSLSAPTKEGGGGGRFAEHLPGGDFLGPPGLEEWLAEEGEVVMVGFSSIGRY